MTFSKGISVVAVVYNEESRIESLIRNFLWSGDIIIIDKSSTDRTFELASNMGVRCFRVPYSENIPVEMNQLSSLAKNEWIFMVTASDIIHPKLAEKLLKLVKDPHFQSDIIEYPFVNHVFGISSSKSPWSGAYRNRLFKRDKAEFVDKVHDEVEFKSSRIFRVPYDSVYAVHHLTHTNLDSFFERHTRYAKLEVEKLKIYGPKGALRKAFISFIRSIIRVIFRKQTFLLGQDGIGLSMAYVSYSMFVFLYTWQYFYGSGASNYKQIRADYEDMWKRSDLN